MNNASTTNASTIVHGNYVPAGRTAHGPYRVDITPDTAGWGYCGLKVLELEPGRSHIVATGDSEYLVLPLSGECTIACEGTTFALHGRRGVFSRVTDFGYLPRDSEATITSATGGRFALPSARCQRKLTPRYGPAENVPSELRGAGNCSRQVNNYCLLGTFEADKLLVCEVLTPSGNWSSYPPHKHDEHTETECELEEIYFFDVAAGPAGPGVGYQRVYGSTQRPIDVLTEVRADDVVLIPHGWHGPSMAAPGYDLYYLNVMAGPGADRTWRICDDPTHAWIRQTWAGQDVDPRLPLTSATEKEADL